MGVSIQNTLADDQDNLTIAENEFNIALEAPSGQKMFHLELAKVAALVDIAVSFRRLLEDGVVVHT